MEKEINNEFIKQIKSDPVIMSFLNIYDKETPEVTEPIEALGEMLLLMKKLEHGQFKVIDNMQQDQSGINNFMKNQLLLNIIKESECVFMTDEMYKLFLEMSKKVRSAYDEAIEKPTPKKLPFNFMWTTVGKGSTIRGKIADSYFMSCELVNGVHLSGHFNYQDEEAHIYRVKDQAGIDSLAIFLEEKIAKIKDVHLSRQIIRSRKKTSCLPTKTIKVVSLRSYQSAQNDNIKYKESDVEWSHRWLVRGHIRNQWIPSRKVHELKWIDPYIKGPEDKPFIKTIRHVKR